MLTLRLLHSSVQKAVISPIVLCATEAGVEGDDVGTKRQKRDKKEKKERGGRDKKDKKGKGDKPAERKDKDKAGRVKQESGGSSSHEEEEEDSEGEQRGGRSKGEATTSCACGAGTELGGSERAACGLPLSPAMGLYFLHVL